MNAVMISMEGREDSAEATILRFKEVGVVVEPFVQPQEWEPGPVSNNHNAGRALQWHIDTYPDEPMIFMEDDLILNAPRFKRALQAALNKDEFVYFYMHDVVSRMKNFYPKEDWIKDLWRAMSFKPKEVDEIQKTIHPDEGLRLLGSYNNIYGSQCIFIPARHKEPLLYETAHETHHTKRIKRTRSRAFDTCVNDYRSHKKVPGYIYLPHPVQHLENRKRRENGKTRKDTISKSFDLVSNLEMNPEGH